MDVRDIDDLNFAGPKIDFNFCERGPIRERIDPGVIGNIGCDRLSVHRIIVAVHGHIADGEDQFSGFETDDLIVFGVQFFYRATGHPGGDFKDLFLNFQSCFMDGKAHDISLPGSIGTGVKW